MEAWIKRCAGVLLHPGSLPGGCITTDAGRFMEFAVAAGLRVWQMLPVGPVDRYGSPYQPDSALAGNVALTGPGPAPEPAEVARYTDSNADWLPDYALFVVLERRYGADWTAWPNDLRDRETAALRAARLAHAQEITDIQVQQCAFDRTWQAFKRRANDCGVLLLGDVPLFVGHHSADVWVHRQLFELDPDGRCSASVGVPPDDFAKDGQWWGFPPYRWEAMAAEHYHWWRRRFEVQSRRFDLVRLDHFRGFAAYWRIPRTAATAAGGEWVAGPGRAAIDVLRPALGAARLVAEDLGYITEDVVELRHSLGIPGMRVLQFAFDGDPHNPNLPPHHGPDTLCYTGTHDNDTTLGWWQSLDPQTRGNVCRYLGHDNPDMPAALVDCAWSSPAPLAIVPMQDLLGLGSMARMNRPGTETGNWRWRFHWDQLPAGLAAQTRDRLRQHGRLA